MKKDKSNRPPKPQAGLCVVRKGSNGFEVLMVTSGAGKWILPKGNVEVGETHQSAAERETREESGIVAKATTQIGTYHDPKKNADVVIFLGEVMNETHWDEQEKRSRAWFPIEKAKIECVSKLQSAIFDLDIHLKKMMMN